MKKKIAIIPARGGSKGILDKNIVMINGKPLIEWSIKNALDSNSIDSVWVTSDSEKILGIAQSCGADIIMRPKEISGDKSSSELAWIDAINQIRKKSNFEIDIVIGMQATSPIREASDLDQAIEEFYSKNLDSLFSANLIDDFNYWSTDSSGNYQSVNYDYKNRRMRQDNETKILENGSFYIFRPDGIIHSKNRLHGKICPFLMDKHKSFQIDEIEDLQICEAIMRRFIDSGS